MAPEGSTTEDVPSLEVVSEGLEVPTISESAPEDVRTSEMASEKPRILYKIHRTSEVTPNLENAREYVPTFALRTPEVPWTLEPSIIAPVYPSLSEVLRTHPEPALAPEEVQHRRRRNRWEDEENFRRRVTMRRFEIKLDDVVVASEDPTRRAAPEVHAPPTFKIELRDLEGVVGKIPVPEDVRRHPQAPKTSEDVSRRPPTKNPKKEPENPASQNPQHHHNVQSNKLFWKVSTRIQYHQWHDCIHKLQYHKRPPMMYRQLY